MLAASFRSSPILSALNQRTGGRQRGFYSEALEALRDSPSSQRRAPPRARLRRDLKAESPYREVIPRASLFTNLVDDAGALEAQAREPSDESALERARTSPLLVLGARERLPRFPGFAKQPVLGSPAPGLGAPRLERQQTADVLWEAATVHAPPKMLGGERGGPLSLLAERRRRVYATQDIAALVQADGVSGETLCGHFVRLDAFDDLELETRTAHEWVAYGRAVHAHDVLADERAGQAGAVAADKQDEPAAGTSASGTAEHGAADAEPVGAPIFLTITDALGAELGTSPSVPEPPVERALRARCLPDERDRLGRWAGSLRFHEACVLEWLSGTEHVSVASRFGGGGTGGAGEDEGGQAAQGLDSAADEARAHALRNGTPMLRVRWREPPLRSDGSGERLPAESWLPRVHCHIHGEDPAVFVRRFVGAHRARARAERALALGLFADCMPEDGVSPMPLFWRRKVMGFVHAAFAQSGFAPDTFPPLARELLADVALDFVRAQNAFSLRRHLRLGWCALPGWMHLPAAAGLPGDESVALAEGDENALALARMLGGTEHQQTLLVTGEVLPPSAAVVGGAVLEPAAMAAIRGSHRNCGPVPLPSGSQVAAQRASFRFGTFLTSAVAIRVLVSLRAENQRVAESLAMFATVFDKALTLDEFDSLQHTQQHALSTFMSDGWAANLRRAMSNHLAHVNKGWFHMREARADTWDGSKLARLFRCVHLMMEEAVLDLRKACADEYRSLIQRHALATVQVVDPRTVRNGPPPGHEHLEDSALFVVELCVADGAFAFQPPLEDFAARVLHVFERAPPLLKGLPTLSPQLLPHLPAHVLGGLTLAEPFSDLELMQQTSAEVSAAMAVALHGLEKYVLSITAQFGSDAALDADQLLAALAEQALSAEELAQRARLHLDHADMLLLEIPDIVRVGPFSVRAAGVKSVLRAHRMSAAAGTLQIIAGMAVELAHAACAACEAVDATLQRDVPDIEALRAIQAELQLAPDTLAEVQATLSRMSATAAHLDSFAATLSAEQQAVYWTALKWPAVLRERIAKTEARFEGDSPLLCRAHALHAPP